MNFADENEINGLMKMVQKRLQNFEDLEIGKQVIPNETILNAKYFG